MSFPATQAALVAAEWALEAKDTEAAVKVLALYSQLRREGHPEPLGGADKIHHQLQVRARRAMFHVVKGGKSS
jgi:hypothetical protein